LKIDVKVITGAKKRELKLEGSLVKARIVAKPVKGKANEELIELLAETLKVKKRDVVIVAGERDTRKTVSVPVDEETLKKVLGSGLE
jgi:uncharacterized protein (TIGR00251 family)